MARRSFRYTLILASVALGAALAAAGGWRYARASAPLSGPIILISVDTLRADHLPAYGYRKVRTPAIDLLAADGVVFNRAYSHAPETLPAHVALLSGRLPFETGVRDELRSTIRPTERLLAQMLRERGYATGAVVSSARLRKETGVNQGFDFFDDAMPTASEEATPSSAERDGGESEQVAEHWLESIGTSRAFLFLHLNEPHAPYAPHERFTEFSPYDGEIAYADDIVGRLVRFLKSHQLYDRSTIVLLSDHGESLGAHGEQEHGLFIYDESIHVPFIVKQESNVGSGRRVADPVQHIDVVPTILDLVKAPVPGNLRGRSLKPLLDGSGRLSEPRIYSESLYARDLLGWSELMALTSDRYRFINAPHEELYDLGRDPREQSNLSSSEREAGRALREELAKVVGPAQLPQATAASQVDPKDKPQVLDTYRRAMDFIGERKWFDAIEPLQRVLGDAPDSVVVWEQLASVARTLARNDLALEAYRHLSELKPSDPSALLGVAEILLRERKFDEAKTEAAAAADLAVADVPSRANAHELLARIAIARHDLDTAREEAAAAQQIEPTRPIASFVEGRILYEQGKYGDALPLLEQAMADARKNGVRPIADLHYYAGDAMMRVDRQDDADAALSEEIRLFPQNVRARASLATLRHSSGDAEAVESIIDEMLRLAPTPESYALATRLWTSFGRSRQAEATRLEGRKLFGDARLRGAASH